MPQRYLPQMPFTFWGNSWYLDNGGKTVDRAAWRA
jgi:hypothetical protein